MDVTLFLLGSATALCTAGFFGWVLELAGWEEKKMAQWADGKPKERSLLHRYGGWLFFPMFLLASLTNDGSRSEFLGFVIMFSTIGLIIAGPFLLWGLLMIYEIVKGLVLSLFKERSTIGQDKDKES
jgi:hypothetical protein